jgi:hypothetical protein
MTTAESLSPGGVRSPSVTRTKLLATLVLVALVTSGCGGLSVEQKAATARFGATTGELADLADVAFRTTRADVVDLRSRMFELGSTSVDLNASATDLDGPLDLEQLEKRLRAAAALRRFGELLTLLVSDGPAARIRASADDLIGEVRAIDGVGLSEDRADAIAALVAKIGGWFIAGKQKRALRGVVLDTNTTIKDLISLIERDLDPAALEWTAALTETVESIHGTLMEEIRLLDPGDKRTLGHLGEIELGQAHIAVLQADSARLALDATTRDRRVRATADDVNIALQKLRLLHSELVTLVQHKEHDLGNFDWLVSQIRDLQSHLTTIMRP